MLILIELCVLDASVLNGWGIGRVLKELGLDSLHVVGLNCFLFWIGFCYVYLRRKSEVMI